MGFIRTVTFFPKQKPTSKKLKYVIMTKKVHNILVQCFHKHPSY